MCLYKGSRFLNGGVSNHKGELLVGADGRSSGILFSSIVLLSIAAISLWSFLLLVQVYIKTPGSFGGTLLFVRHSAMLIWLRPQTLAVFCMETRCG